MKTLTALALVSLLTVSTATARADEAAPAAPADFHADAEIDPTAYALDGYSLHVGLGWKRLRLDLGVYALALPDAFDGSDDFSAAFDGYGIKLQYFPFAAQRGGFVGVDGGFARVRVSLDDSDLSKRVRQLSAGVHAGWRFAITRDLYATPWLGVGYSTDPGDVMLDGKTYTPTRVTIFPAVHVGYRFR